MTRDTLIHLCAGLPPAHARRVLGAILAHDAAPSPTSLEDFKAQAAAAFESDMQPVCNALSAALQAGDLEALRGLRALLPHLLNQVNQQPALGDLLAHQLGKQILEGMRTTEGGE